VYHISNLEEANVCHDPRDKAEHRIALQKCEKNRSEQRNDLRTRRENKKSQSITSLAYRASFNVE
jgi:hypothetical protein